MRRAGWTTRPAVGAALCVFLGCLAQPGAGAGETPPPAPAPAAAADGPDAKVEGYHPIATGGEGGQAFEVTTLEDSGAGSFREALDKVNALEGKPARIVFRVGGVIRVLSPLHLGGSNATIDGSTAPPPGITLSGRDIMKYLYDENGFLDVPVPKAGRGGRFQPGTVRFFRGPLLAIAKAENIVIRDVRFRETPAHQILVAGGAKRFLLDHVSSTECGDGALFINNGCENFTICWSVFAGCNLCVRTRGDRVSFHHCLFAENAQRNPLVRGDGVRDLRNNVVLNWRITGIHTSQDDTPKLNLINCLFSPAAGAGRDPARVLEVRGAMHLYAHGNIGPGSLDLDGRSTVREPFEEPPVTTQPADEARNLVLGHAGARPRDEIDRGYADGTRPYAQRLKEEWRMAEPWWTKEKPPPRPAFVPDWSREGGGDEEKD